MSKRFDTALETAYKAGYIEATENLKDGLKVSPDEAWEGSFIKKQIREAEDYVKGGE